MPVETKCMAAICMLHAPGNESIGCSMCVIFCGIWHQWWLRTQATGSVWFTCCTCEHQFLLAYLVYVEKECMAFKCVVRCLCWWYGCRHSSLGLPAAAVLSALILCCQSSLLPLPVFAVLNSWLQWSRIAWGCTMCMRMHNVNSLFSEIPAGRHCQHLS